MSELLLGERPRFEPTPAGATDVWRRARRRRRRQLTGAGSGLLSVALVVAIVTLGTPPSNRDTDRLNVAGLRPSHSPTPQLTAHPRRDQASATPSSKPTTPGAQPPGPVSSALNPPAPPGSDDPTPSAPTFRHSAAAPIHRSTVSYDGNCDPSNDIDGWCQLYTGPTTAKRKHDVTLSMELCRMPFRGDGTLTFADTRQIDLEIDAYDGKEQWRAGQHEHYRSPGPTVTVAAGTCLRWTSTWDTIAPDGFYAPPGDYSIGYGVESDTTNSFTSGVTFTLTD